MRLAVAGLRVRQRFGVADQAESGLRAGLVVGDGGGFEITGVIRRGQVVLGVDQACRRGPAQVVGPLPLGITGHLPRVSADDR